MGDVIRSDVVDALLALGVPLAILAYLPISRPMRRRYYWSTGAGPAGNATANSDLDLLALVNTSHQAPTSVM